MACTSPGLNEYRHEPGVTRLAGTRSSSDDHEVRWLTPAVVAAIVALAISVCSRSSQPGSSSELTGRVRG